jgi:16S rRNA (adenine1518-N6/adenine1519-N6)-dimethyltransferase
MHHIPKKKFGQNFLQNQAIINSIIMALSPKKIDKIIEIGPGLGALTAPLLAVIDNLTVIEIDKDLQDYLTNEFKYAHKLNIIKNDVLKVDFSQLGKNLRLIGNLPYNISTPLLVKLIQFKPYISDMLFMLQKEVVDRITASPNCKQYGRLTIMLQNYFVVEHILDVPSHAFNPEPKVESAVIRLTPISNENLNTHEFKSFEKLITQAFGMRRKTIANNLKPLISADNLRNIGIEPSLRPEQISIKEYIVIKKFISK